MQKIKRVKNGEILLNKVLKSFVYSYDKNGDVIIFLESEDRNVVTIETKSPKVKTQLFTEQFLKYFNMN